MTLQSFTKRPAIFRKRLRRRYWKLGKILRPHLAKSWRDYCYWWAKYSGELHDAFNHDDFPPIHGSYIVWKGAITTAPSRILELGSYQGGSAVVWARLFPDANITCVDAWKEYFGRLTNLDEAESIFDKVTVPFSKRLRKIKSDTFSALSKLINDGEMFDVIYIDAGHFEDNVLIDTYLSWRMLGDGGVLVWDDYAIGLAEYIGHQPRHAIDHFLNRHIGEYRVLSVYPQVIIQKCV